MDILTTYNPSTGEKLADYPLMQQEELDRRLQEAGEAYRYWSALEVAQRSFAVGNLARELDRDLDDLARLMSEEMGKIRPEAEAELKKCIRLCEYYAAHAEAWLADEDRSHGEVKAMVQYAPLGAVLAIMPWNFPVWQVLRCAVPALLAGNVVLLKHAPNVTGCALQLDDLFVAAGFPEYTFQSLVIDVDQVESILARPLIAGVALTGSTRAGAAVAQLAGKHIKRSVLELGGSDPFIVLADADIDKAVETAVQSRFGNAGQSCIAAKRWIVVEEVYESFRVKAIQKIRSLRQGDPLQDDIQVGPMARPDLADQFMQQYNKSVSEGADVLVPCIRNACHVSPGLLGDVTPEMTAFREELFGPCGVLIKAKDADDAIRLANDTIYGLGSTIFTADHALAMQLAQQIHSGNVFINTIMRSDPALPFGGVGMSGYGKELGREGILEFVNKKVVVG